MQVDAQSGWQGLPAHLKTRITNAPDDEQQFVLKSDDLQSLRLQSRESNKAVRDSQTYRTRTGRLRVLNDTRNRKHSLLKKAQAERVIETGGTLDEQSERGWHTHRLVNLARYLPPDARHTVLAQLAGQLPAAVLPNHIEEHRVIMLEIAHHLPPDARDAALAQLA